MSEANVAVLEASLHIRRTFPATAQQLFECFTNPMQLLRWWGPEGTTCPAAEVDLQTGGAYRLEILSETGNLSVVSGEYLEIDPPHRLVFTWRWDDTPTERTRVSLAFNETGAGSCELVLVHEKFPDDDRASLHGDGWSSSLNRLATLLATD